MSANALATLPGPAGPLDAMLPSTDTIACQAINAWLQKYAGELRWDAAGRSYSSCWEAPLVAEMRVAVELTFGVRSVMLAVDHLAALSPLLVGEPFMHMPVALRDMILHRLLSQLFVALPGPLRDSVDVRATHWGVAALSQWSCVLGFTLSQLSSGAASRCIVATRSAADLDWLRSSLPSRTTPMPRLRSSLRLPMRLYLGTTGLPQSCIDSLHIGDVVWIEDARQTRRGIAVRFGSQAADANWCARVQHRRLLVLERKPPGSESWPIHPGGDMSINQTRPIEIPVTFDLGEIPVTLRELEQLQPGHVFELPQEANDAIVHLRVAGQVVAAGRLVAVGRRLGVRMTDTRALRESADDAAALRP